MVSGWRWSMLWEAEKISGQLAGSRDQRSPARVEPRGSFRGWAGKGFDALLSLLLLCSGSLFVQEANKTDGRYAWKSGNPSWATYGIRWPGMDLFLYICCLVRLCRPSAWSIYSEADRPHGFRPGLRGRREEAGLWTSVNRWAEPSLWQQGCLPYSCSGLVGRNLFTLYFSANPMSHPMPPSLRLDLSINL